MIGHVFNMRRPQVPPQKGKGREERKKNGREKGGREGGEGAVKLTSKVAVPFFNVLKCPSDAIILVKPSPHPPALTPFSRQPDPSGPMDPAP